MGKAKEKLDEISRYKDNWNGYGAKAYSEMFIKYASDVIDSLPVEPDVFPLADDGLQLEVSSNDKIEIHIILHKDFTIDVALYDWDDLIWNKKNISRKELPHTVATFISIKEPSEFPRM
jgi:hypothetical protein